MLATPQLRPSAIVFAHELNMQNCDVLVAVAVVFAKALYSVIYPAWFILEVLNDRLYSPQQHIADDPDFRK